MDVNHAQCSAQSILYNDKPCYQITLKPSKIKYYGKLALPFIVAALATLLLASVSFYIQLLFFIMTVLLLFIGQKTSDKFNRSKKIKLPNGFLLELTGNCIFTNIIDLEKQENVMSITQQLSCRSRVSFLGCWLYFDKNEQNTIANMRAPVLILPQPWFIFRDSLSTQDFARLARVINSLSIIQHKAKSKLSKSD